MNKELLTIIDGDFLLFFATMGNKVLDSEGNPLRENNKFVYTPRTEEEVYDSASSIMYSILNMTNADKYIGYLGGATKSFRYNTFPEYKINRIDLVKPNFYWELKKYLINTWNFIETQDGLEADDAVNIVRNNFKNDYNCTIVSNDKDLIKSIEGKYLNPRNMEIVEVSKEEAEVYFWKSMIIGDVIDGIKGIPGRGEVFANKIVNAVEELHTTLPMEILNQYIKHFGEYKGIEEFHKNYKCLYILDKFDNFVIPDLISWKQVNQWEHLEQELGDF